ncbi:hypothetical protein [Mycobacterium sp. E3339]|uniref:hypothetical protein n=1 Tax=Mycobacterium sp. E3339 TaxID=1834146 RepID=UPI001E41F322|nr:hypothetical protein [Mycobacterium sp. E3339]
MIPKLQGGATDGFAISLIRQYLEGGEDTGVDSPIGQADWLSANLKRLEQLFAEEPSSASVCADLISLRRSNSSKKWGWPKPEQL